MGPPGCRDGPRDSLCPVKRRTRLLVSSLVVAAIASVAIVWAIARSNNSDDAVVRIDGSGPTSAPGGGGFPVNKVVKGKPLPGVDVLDLKGTKVATKSLLGTPLVINVWGSTCGPCKKELPDFAKVQKLYAQRVRFVGVDYLPPSDHEEQFARSKGVQYELLYDGTGQFIAKVGISAFPVTLFVKADGTIVQQTGQLDEAKLTALIKSELL
jgi:thiol-disulfide isomerase/thioredoxin